MYRLILGISITLASLNAISQELSFKEIESKTYQLFTDEKWDELIEYSEAIMSPNVDYYYFNVRLGVAYYNSKQYLQAEKYMLKALSNNSSDYAKEYLVWIYQWLDDSYGVDQMYDKLSEEAKKEMQYKKKNLDFVYIEGGLKKMSSPNANSNILFANAVVQHRLIKNSRLYHNFSSYSQKSSYNKLLSYNYVLALNIPMPKGVMTAEGLFDKYHYEEPAQGTLYYKNLQQNTLGGALGYTVNFNRVKLNADVRYLTTTSDSNLSIESTLINPLLPVPITPNYVNTTVSMSSLLTSLSLYYTPSLFNNRITLGIDNYLIFSNGDRFYNIKPNMSISLNNKIWLNASYLNVGDYVFYDKYTKILFNKSATNTDRYSLSMHVLLKKNLILTATYVYEDIKGLGLNKIDAKINSFFLGVNFKF